MKKITILGGGIVGSALAWEMSKSPNASVVVLESGDREVFPGSTGHAPGYIGVFNEIPALQSLAEISVEQYLKMCKSDPRLAEQTGSVEVAFSQDQLNELETRCALANRTGIRAEFLDAKTITALAPDFIRSGSVVGGVHYPDDCTGDARLLSQSFRKMAEENGAIFHFNTEVDRVNLKDGKICSVSSGEQEFAGDEFVVAVGIWSAKIAEMVGIQLPLFPVAHPYVYGESRADASLGPFVRYPAKHVYARYHDQTPGFGSYDHGALEVRSSELGATAELPWGTHDVDGAIDRAIEMFPMSGGFKAAKKLLGLFSMTPDNVPFLGPVQSVPGLWVASAIWVTHAYGSAKVLTDAILTGNGEQSILQAANPDRFQGQNFESLRHEALRLYNDIYGGGEDQ